MVEQPRLLRTRLGANLSELTAGELQAGVNRVISGSVLGGRTAQGAFAFLGRYHLQVSCLAEGNDHEMLHYLRAGVNKHSVMNIFVSKLLAAKKFAFSTTTNGSPRAMVPVSELRSGDAAGYSADAIAALPDRRRHRDGQKLGCLELDEEDLALCTYVCAGKYEYGQILRDNLARIEKEG